MLDFELNQKQIESIAGGVMSSNRNMDPMRMFVRAKGSYVWDHTNKKYIDYHAAFATCLLGHGDPDVDQAAMAAIKRGDSLIGAGMTPWELQIAELLVECVPYIDQVRLTGSGTEAVAIALRIARSFTERDDILSIQGGYNGWMDSVAFNFMDPSSSFSDHVPGTEHELRPISAGMGACAGEYSHVVEFNDIEAVEKVLRENSVAAVVLEPCMQNIGIVKPQQGYLQAVRDLCDRYGTVLIFNEVETGFRQALGGYQSICGISPDLSVFGKAVANGYPMAVIGGQSKYMSFVAHSDPAHRVRVSGTYNAHPFVVAAAVASIKKLRNLGDEIYPHLERLGALMEDGLNDVFSNMDYPATVVRQGSSFVVYFMDHAPTSWKDIALHHNAKFDIGFRKMLIASGVFLFPVETKTGSISFAHTQQDIEQTLDVFSKVIHGLRRIKKSKNN